MARIEAIQLSTIIEKLKDSPVSRIESARYKPKWPRVKLKARVDSGALVPRETVW